MTEKEAIKEIRERICCEKPIQHFCDDSCMYGIKDCPFGIAIEVLEKAEKYKWHDLWNNPEDLPKSAVDVLVYDGDYGVGSYKAVLGEWNTTDNNIEGNCITAWRYIEPFEEEETK